MTEFDPEPTLALPESGHTVDRQESFVARVPGSSSIASYLRIDVDAATSRADAVVRLVLADRVEARLEHENVVAGLDRDQIDAAGDERLDLGAGWTRFLPCPSRPKTTRQSHRSRTADAQRSGDRRVLVRGIGESRTRHRLPMRRGVLEEFNGLVGEGVDRRAGRLSRMSTVPGGARYSQLVGGDDTEFTMKTMILRALSNGAAAAGFMQRLEDLQQSARRACRRCPTRAVDDGDRVDERYRRMPAPP